MSDHEDGAQDDWEEGTLPPSTLGAGTPYTRSESLMKPSRNIPSHLRGPLQDNTNTRGFPGIRRGDPAKDDRRYPRRPPINPASGIPGRSTGVESRYARTRPPQTDEATMIRPSGKPTSSYVMSVTWSTLLTNINANGLPPARVARMRLDEIAATTNTYIETPDVHTTEIWIWGTSDQARQAYDLLRIWESEVRNSGRRPHRDQWIKQNALDGRVEERKERQAMQKVVRTQWKAFEESFEHSHELCIMWSASIGLEDFQHEHAQTIQALGDTYDCRIICNRINNMVHVFGHDSTKVHAAHSRIINIAREMVAKRNEVIRANFLRLPSAKTYRSDVQLIKDERTENFLPSLCGGSLAQDEIDRYQIFVKSANHNTRVKTRRHIERGLTGHLQLSSKHVRMRVNFLDLGFLQYKRPSHDKPHHDFLEYVEMIGDERTKIKAQGLHHTGKDISRLGDKLAQHLGQPQTAYAVHFDFGMGAAQNGTTLRFECDLRPSFMEGEVEKTAERWLEHRSEVEDDLLLINVLDFDRPDYQIAIRAVPIPDNQAIQGEMDLFRRGVEFSPPPEGIKAPQKRRVKFPPGRQALKQVSEMTILKYNFKEQGVFEFRRRDSYLINSNSKAITTDWSACYYYQDWDNMMGKFGDLKPGQDVDFDRSVATFFPVENHGKVDAGLHRFTNEIFELQALLGVCIAELPAIKVEKSLQLPTPPAEDDRKTPSIRKNRGEVEEGQWNVADEAGLNGNLAPTNKGKGRAKEDGLDFETNVGANGNGNGGSYRANEEEDNIQEGQWTFVTKAKANVGPFDTTKRNNQTSPNITRKRQDYKKTTRVVREDDD